jgi:signal transduction histidine kinase
MILDNEIAEKNLEISAEIENIEIYSSSELLQEVWINILSNAIKFSHSGGTIEISLSSDGKNAVVCITDHGIGMSENVKERIFDQYYQADTSHRSSGFGLGLSIAKRIVELHDGTINVESSIGVGSSFTVSLPLVFLS